MTDQDVLIRGVLFDFDGVVIDSMNAHLKAWHLAYNKLFSENKVLTDFDVLKGRSTAAIATSLCNGRTQYRQLLINTKNDFLREKIDNIDLIPGILELLSELQTKSIPFGIVSNAPKQFIKDVLTDKRIKVPFFHAREDYYRPKPDPEPFIKGIKSLGFDYTTRNNIVFFEDSTHGLESGINAGLYPIGISSQHRSEILKKAGAKAVFNNHKESLPFILSRID